MGEKEKKKKERKKKYSPIPWNYPRNAFWIFWSMHFLTTRGLLLFPAGKPGRIVFNLEFTNILGRKKNWKPSAPSKYQDLNDYGFVKCGIYWRTSVIYTSKLGLLFLYLAFYLMETSQPLRSHVHAFISQLVNEVGPSAVFFFVSFIINI